MDRGKEVKVEEDKLRILSIDGGGVRGVIPAAILKYLEQRLLVEEQRLLVEEQRRKLDETKYGVIRLADYFDLIVGTSTGGLITAMITTPRPREKDQQELPLSAEQVLKFYENNAARIFPRTRGKFRKLLEKVKILEKPRFSSKELNDLLGKLFDDRKLSKARTNVIIPSFDIKSQQPVFFSSWKNKINDVLVKDVCRATAAAPTYFPPAYFTVPSTEDTYDYTDDATDDGTDDDTEVTVEEEEREEKEKKEDPPSQAANKTRHFNMIDGGIAANNPTFVGITQAIQYLSGDNLAGDPADKSSFKKLLVLSLGTGRHRTGYLAKDAKKWGVRKWLYHKGDTPLISSLQNASTDMVDYNLSKIFGAHGSPENYLRIQTDISKNSPEVWKLDNATKRNLTTLDELGNQLLEQYATTANFETGNLVPSPVRNDEALNRFAKELVSLRKRYPRKVWFAESSRAGQDRGK